MNTLTKTDTKTNSGPLPVHITDRDKRYLEKMIAKMDVARDHLEPLLAKLDRANVVKSEFIPRNVVTMNSQVSIIDRDSFVRQRFTLVFPEEADPEKNRIAVTSSLGSSLYGYHTGDEFEVNNRRYVIAKVDYQPDAANHYRL